MIQVPAVPPYCNPHCSQSCSHNMACPQPFRLNQYEGSTPGHSHLSFFSHAAACAIPPLNWHPCYHQSRSPVYTHIHSTFTDPKKVHAPSRHPSHAPACAAPALCRGEAHPHHPRSRLTCPLSRCAWIQQACARSHGWQWSCRHLARMSTPDFTAQGCGCVLQVLAWLQPV